MGEEMRHVQMSRWGKYHRWRKRAAIYNGYEAEDKAF